MEASYSQIGDSHDKLQPLKKTSGSGDRLGLLEPDEPEDLFRLLKASDGGEFPPPSADLLTGSKPSESFLRTSQRVPVRRRRGSRFGWKSALKNRGQRLIAASVALLVLALAAAIAMGFQSVLLHNSYFVLASAEDIQVTGNRVVAVQEVKAAFAADVRHSIFRVPLAQRKADLERIPWVRLATVMRLWPDRLRVSLAERMPVAFVRDDNIIRLVDDQGVMLPLPDAISQHYAFPVLTGISASDPLAIRAKKIQEYLQFAKALDADGGHISATLSEVDLTDPEDVRAVFAASVSQPLVHFGNSDFLARYLAYRAHLPEWLRKYPQLRSVDMRYGRQVVLDTGATPPTSDGPLQLPQQSAKLTSTPVVNAVTVRASGSHPAVRSAPYRGAARRHSQKRSPERGHIVLHPLMHIVKGT